VNCSACGQANEPGRKFCAECGAALPLSCEQCGAANSAGAKFCGDCGAALAPPSRQIGERAAGYESAAAGAEAQRRQVTVLFIDLVDFTALAEEHDAEDVRALQSRYFALARETIGRYGGTVEKYIGDAVMAVWGAPVAYEDDAERAVRAALDVVGSVGTVDAKLVARAGVVTGEAAVSLSAVDEGMVTGDAVTTASRLQSVARAGTVLVSDATRSATREAIAFERVADQSLKGKSQPLAAWRAVRVVAGRRGVGRSEQLEPPFVGREAELRQLKDLLHTAAAAHRTRLVSVVGVAGVGKSRLAWELEKYIDGIVEDVYWHYGRSPAHGEGLTFWALAEMVRQRAGIAEGDDEQSGRRCLAETIADFVTDAGERAWVEPRLQALLGLGEVPAGDDQQALFAAWRRFFERIAEHGTTVLVFEDLQWADSGLVDFINSLVEWARHSPLLIVTLARPEVFTRHPGWGAGQVNFVALHLEPMTDAEIELLLQGVAPGLPSDAIQAIVARAEGIPLYAVETVRMLIDSGSVVRSEDTGTYRAAADLAQLRVAESLHALVAARLDTLTRAERELIQDASVIGQTFSLGALQALGQRSPAELERLLGGLVRRELLARVDDPTSPERGQYTFVQSVVREVAYETMSRATRRAKHVSAARELEASGEEDLSALLASHYLRAQQLAGGAEAEALAGQARVALRAAAERAATLRSSEQAIVFLEQALALTAAPAEQALLLERAGTMAETAARLDESESYYDRAYELYMQLGDMAAASRARARLGAVRMFAGRPAEAIELLEPILAEVEASGDNATAAQVGAQLGRAYMMAERNDRALAVLDRALDYASALDDVPTIVDILTSKGPALETLGRRREAVAVLAGALELADDFDLKQARFRTLYNLTGRVVADDPRRAYQIQRQGLQAARELGQQQWLQAFGALLVHGEIAEGNWDAALALADELGAAALPDLEQANVDSGVAIVFAYRGDDERALALMREADKRMSGVTTYAELGWLQYVHSEVEAAAGRYREAYRWLVESSRSPFWAALNMPLGANLALLLGDATMMAEVQAEMAKWPAQTGRFNAAVRLRADACAAAMAGRATDAAAGLRTAAAEFRSMGGVIELAQTAHLAVVGLGREHSLAKELAAEARQVLEPLQARALLAHLDGVGVEAAPSAGHAAV
jgi:class 3 adenylate cyclase/tetratricopeptide (TPR) repeat protein